jgi:N-acetylmuramoyl-L-alanine amidase
MAFFADFLTKNITSHSQRHSCGFSLKRSPLPSRAFLLCSTVFALSSVALAQDSVEDPNQIVLPSEPAAPPVVIKPLSWKNIPEILGTQISAPRVGVYAGYTRLVFDLPKDTLLKVTPLPNGFSLELTGVKLARNLSEEKISNELSSWKMENTATGVLATLKTSYAVRDLSSSSSSTSSGGYKILAIPHGIDSPNDRLVLDLSPAFANRTPLALEQMALEPFPIGFQMVLDPGHGGNDPGAIGAVIEKETTLKVALMVRDLLEAAGATVHMTRVDDQILSSDKPTDLKMRGQMGKAPQNLYVSIHVNSLKKTNYLRGYGLETFWYSNNVESKHLAESLNTEMLNLTGSFARGVRNANLAVLRNAEVPATLVEIGFTSHPVDGENLRNDAYLERIALGIARGIRNFMGIPSELPK